LLCELPPIQHLNCRFAIRSLKALFNHITLSAAQKAKPATVGADCRPLTFSQSLLERTHVKTLSKSKSLRKCAWHKLNFLATLSRQAEGKPQAVQPHML
jgi:hypothetical protein